MNGVINIITKKSKDTPDILASTVVGTEETIGAIRYDGTVGEDFQYRATAKGSTAISATRRMARTMIGAAGAAGSEPTGKSVPATSSRFTVASPPA